MTEAAAIKISKFWVKIILLNFEIQTTLERHGRLGKTDRLEAKLRRGLPAFQG